MTKRKMATQTADPALVQHMLRVALQGGGQVRWKPSEKRRPHPASSIQLPAVYETWKEPSRAGRRRAKAAAAAAAGASTRTVPTLQQATEAEADDENQRNSRSVPSLSRREASDGPGRAVSSAPSTKSNTAGHETHKAREAMQTKTSPPPRLPKINTLVRGGAASKSTPQNGSPPLKIQHGKRKKQAGVPQASNGNEATADDSRQPVERTISLSEKSGTTKAAGDVSEKTSHPSKTHKINDRQVTENKAPKPELTKGQASKHDKRSTLDKSQSDEVSLQGSPGEKRTVNVVAKREEEKNAPRTTLNKADNIKPESTLSSTAIDKNNNKSKLLKSTLSHKDHAQPKSEHQTKDSSTLPTENGTFRNRTLDNSDSKIPNPARTTRNSYPPSRVSNTRASSTANYRVNTRSKTDLTRTKPPLLKRRSKVGHFTAAGEFVTNDDDGKRSEISGVTVSTKQTGGKRSEISGATVSTRNTDASSRSRDTNASVASTASSNRTGKSMKRRPIIITKKTLARQRFYNGVYNNRNYKLQRQTNFLKRVETVQLRTSDEKVRRSVDREKRKQESVVRQYEALKQIRDRFDEEQVKRFSRQYVSWKSVETDRLGRQSVGFGLPDNIYEDRYEKTLKKMPEPAKSPTKRAEKRGKQSFQRYARWVKNIKRFELILKPNTGAGLEGSLLRSSKGALVEGRDIVELHGTADEQGAEATKKVKVRSIIGSAKRLLQAAQDMDAISEVSDESDNDDDNRLRINYDDFDDVSSLELSDRE